MDDEHPHRLLNVAGERRLLQLLVLYHRLTDTLRVASVQELIPLRVVGQ
jgi:hypothetical protein